MTSNDSLTDGADYDSKPLLEAHTCNIHLILTTLQFLLFISALIVVAICYLNIATKLQRNPTSPKKYDRARCRQANGLVGLS